MAIKNIFGKKSKATPVGKTLEVGAEESKVVAKGASSLARWLILLSVAAAAILGLPGQSNFDNRIQVGEVWTNDGIIAPFDYPIYKSDEEIETEKEEVRRRVPATFNLNANAPSLSIGNLDSLESQLDRALLLKTSWDQNLLAGKIQEALVDSARYAQIKTSLPISLSNERWNLLQSSYAVRMQNTSRFSGPPTMDRMIYQRVRSILEAYADQEVTDLSLDNISSETIAVLDEQSLSTFDQKYERLIDLSTVQRLAENTLAEDLSQNQAQVEIAMQFFNASFVTKYSFDRKATEELWNTAFQEIAPTKNIVKKDEEIISRGEIVTQEKKAAISSLSRAIDTQQNVGDRWMRLGGYSMLIIASLLIFYLFLRLVRNDLLYSNRDLLLIAVNTVIVIAFLALAVRLGDMYRFAVPLAIAPIILTVIYNSRVGIFALISLALIASIYFNNDFRFVLLSLFAGAVGVFSMRDVKTRTQIMITGGLIFLSYVFILVGIELTSSVQDWRKFLITLAYLGANAVLLTMMFSVLIWLDERLFGVTTDVTLMELSDTNHPLIKELSLRAPGTFNHSLQVANLAEAGAEAIGANGLLARVGALYHDVGKMLKPEYFIENQGAIANPHDKLQPTMSALVVVNHVKDGIQLAKEHKLPQTILDFIPMHHGTSRVEYFYQKALASDLGGSEVVDGDFRYPGPRPNTRESGILMLADSVEAAAKSLEKPTVNKLENLIDSIFKSRLEDQQLDLCPLTFADLEKVKSTFLNILSGMYHFRVKYPGQEQEGGEDESSESKQLENEVKTENASHDGARISNDSATQG